MAARLSALRAGRPLPPKKIPDTHFCYSLCRSHGNSATGRIRSIEKSNDLIGNRTGGLPACSKVPQPNMLPSALTEMRLIVNVKEEQQDLRSLLHKFIAP
jgi:hypothetical protein